MKRSRRASREAHSRETAVAELQRLAVGLAEAGGRLEYRWWEARLIEYLDSLFDGGEEEAVLAAIEQMFETITPAHDALADVLEFRTETVVLETAGQAFDVQLLAAPVLAWSRFAIPSGAIRKAPLQTLQQMLQSTVLAEGAQLALADFLFSPDQLPRSFGATRQLARDLGEAALSGSTLHLDSKQMPETNRFLSDARYLMAAVVVPHGQPLFRWNAATTTDQACQEAWAKQAGSTFEGMLPGCHVQVLPPNAYHTACRETDKASRTYSIRATLAFLAMVLDVPVEHYNATIAPFHGKRLEEYRIGIGPRGGNMVFYGVIWPLLGGEDDSADITGEIEQLLRECGVQEIVTLDHSFPLEYCEDCGAPLFPNHEGDLMHPEMPETAEGQDSHPVLH